MAAYDPPTLALLTASVSRDLSDPANAVFTTTQIADFINGGIAELNRVRPKDYAHPITWDYDLDTMVIVNLPVDNPFRVEVRHPAGTGHGSLLIPSQKSGASTINGWEYFQRSLMFGPIWEGTVVRLVRDEGWTILVWGYQGRDPLTDDAQVADFETQTEEQLVRLYCRMEGYRTLTIDRGLFQQWQMQANNSDVSPTQMNQMLTVAESSFDRQQKRMFQPRRVSAD